MKLDQLKARNTELLSTLTPEREDRLKRLANEIIRAEKAGKSFKDIFTSNADKKLVPSDGLRLRGKYDMLHHVKLNARDKDIALFWFKKGGKIHFYLDNHEPPVYARVKAFYNKIKS
ncbi:MAG: hypothetical protein N0C84_01310 [Candidatus Thiodiazotropha taylori]|uniref:Uncharacterized protein n=1 Tax=Candidatus Thiodiazotropha taylori TaxID=2792791 RepID=A0A9E4N393_9GAMM|nr:hypothetical protein [Candidatus Thiodiazotropha taylori]MCW4255085.1 hypothetical protein [Candidatus Thiodiazotropha taylori]